MTAGTDTALAHRLLEAGLVDPLILQGCLGEVRTRRGADPDVSLALLLVERRIVPPEQLESLLYGHHVSLQGSASDLLPSRFGEFEVVRELERGGMGAVLEVRSPQRNRLALKTLLPGGAADPELRARFQREAELTARLDHPHVVRIHAAALEASPPYLVIDHLPGGTLHERITRANGLPLEESLSVALKLASALQHAHARGVLHRDLKPENVLFDDRGEPRVIDWGLARSVAEVSQHLTQTGTLLGTPAYMAPEQALALAAVGPEADVYSLGAVLFACLCGRPPFSAPQLLATLDKVIHAPPPSPSRLADLGALAPALDALMARLLAKDPAERPTLGELSEDLRALLRGEGPRAERRSPLLYVFAGLFVLICVGVSLAIKIAPGEETIRQDYFAWEAANLSGYSLDVAPVPSAAELRAARERFLELRVSDEQNSLSAQRFSAYDGLLDLLEGRPAPQVSGAPGAVLAAVEAYRRGDLRATYRRAKRALSLAQPGGPERPERAAAMILLASSAPDLRELVRLQREFEPEGGPLASALEARSSKLVVELLAEFPREGEGWSSETRRIAGDLTLARELKVPPASWWRGFQIAAPRWRSRLDAIRRPAQAEDLGLALERLNPPGFGPEVRGLLQEAIDRFARLNEVHTQNSARTLMHETLAVALALDDGLARVDPAYEVSPATRRIVCGQHNSLSPGADPELATACALFALRNADYLSLNDIRSHLSSQRLKLILARRARPQSAAQRLAQVLDRSRHDPKLESTGAIAQRIEALSALLDLAPSDISPAIRALTQLWLAELHEVQLERPGADALRLATRGAHWARLALEGLPDRRRWHNSVQATHHLSRLTQLREGSQAAANLWTPLLERLRLAYSPESEALGDDSRTALLWALASVARLRQASSEFEDALRLGREVERLALHRHAWEDYLPRGYEIQAVALRALERDEEAWAALHVDKGLFGSSVTYAEQILELGVALDRRQVAQEAYHESFSRPFPSKEDNRRRRHLSLGPDERIELEQRALELGYPVPPNRYPD